jgi:hypothetical protein
MRLIPIATSNTPIGIRYSLFRKRLEGCLGSRICLELKVITKLELSLYLHTDKHT